MTFKDLKLGDVVIKNEPVDPWGVVCLTGVVTKKDELYQQICWYFRKGERYYFKQLGHYDENEDFEYAPIRNFFETDNLPYVFDRYMNYKNSTGLYLLGISTTEDTFTAYFKTDSLYFQVMGRVRYDTFENNRFNEKQFFYVKEVSDIDDFDIPVDKGTDFYIYLGSSDESKKVHYIKNSSLTFEDFVHNVMRQENINGHPFLHEGISFLSNHNKYLFSFHKTDIMFGCGCKIISYDWFAPVKDRESFTHELKLSAADIILKIIRKQVI